MTTNSRTKENLRSINAVTMTENGIQELKVIHLKLTMMLDISSRHYLDIKMYKIASFLNVNYVEIL